MPPKKDAAAESSKKKLLAQISSLAKELQRFTSVKWLARDGTGYTVESDMLISMEFGAKLHAKDCEMLVNALLSKSAPHAVFIVGARASLVKLKASQVGVYLVTSAVSAYSTQCSWGAKVYRSSEKAVQIYSSRSAAGAPYTLYPISQAEDVESHRLIPTYYQERTNFCAGATVDETILGNKCSSRRQRAVRRRHIFRHAARCQRPWSKPMRKIRSLVVSSLAFLNNYG
jgi:hypothetical protein